jgi:hypothetical protein
MFNNAGTDTTMSAGTAAAAVPLGLASNAHPTNHLPNGMPNNVYTPPHVTVIRVMCDNAACRVYLGEYQYFISISIIIIVISILV